jgi:hypothetical protein
VSLVVDIKWSIVVSLLCIVTKLLRNCSRWRSNSVLSSYRSRKLGRIRLHQPPSPYQPRSLRSLGVSISGLRTQPSSPIATLRESAVVRNPTTRDPVNKSNLQSLQRSFPSRIRFHQQPRP